MLMMSSIVMFPVCFTFFSCVIRCAILRGDLKSLQFLEGLRQAIFAGCVRCDPCHIVDILKHFIDLENVMVVPSSCREEAPSGLGSPWTQQ
jgi:hypothetical protein